MSSVTTLDSTRVQTYRQVLEWPGIFDVVKCRIQLDKFLINPLHCDLSVGNLIGTIGQWHHQRQ